MTTTGAALLLVLAACGGSDVTEGPSSAGDLSTDGQSSTDGAQTFEEFFGYGDDFDVEAQIEEDRAREMEVQEKTAACMAEQGFEYTPYVPEEMFTYYGGPDEDLTEEERMKKYGYGFFTYMLEEAENYEEFEDPYSPENDPNWVRMDAMSDSEREAYEKALWGDWENFDFEPEYDEEGNEIFVEPDFTEIGGCMTLAQEEVWGGGQEFDEEMMAISEQLEPLWQVFYERIESDPRMVEANQEWASCMAERGYTFTNQEDIFMYLDEMQQELWSNQEDYVFEEGTDTTIDEGTDFGPFGPGIDEAMIQELADEELAIAADDWECRGDLSFEELYREISEEYEAQFIAENRELLEKQRALMEEAGF